MPYPTDPTAQRLLAHIQRMLPDLPRILGAEWPDFEGRLQALLRQLDQPNVTPVVVEAQVLSLFASYPRVMKSWRDMTLRGGGGQVIERGSAGAWIAETFQPAQSAQPVQSAQSVQAAAPLTRYTDLRCPRQVALNGGEFQVTVRLTLRPNAESRDAQQLSVLTRQPVVVELDAPDFIFTEGSTRSLDVSQEQDSPWAVFGLKPRQSGPAEVRLRFWQGSSYLGQARCDLLVVERPVTLQPQPQPALALAFGTNNTPPKRILNISLRGESLHFALCVDGAALKIPLPPVDLRTSPIRWMQRRYAGLNALAEQAAGSTFDAQAAAEDAQQLGNLLWNDLISENLQHLWLDERTAWAAEPLLIVSDEAYIPWELVWPNVAGVNAPWGAHGPLSRWLGVDSKHSARSGPSERLALSPWAGLIPQDSGISFLADEAAMLRRLLPAGGERSLPHTRRRAVLDLLAGGECGWLHAASHGLLDPGGDAEGASLLLEGDERLEPEVLVRTAVRAGLDKSRPGVFWNICHGGSAGWSLTGVGGWAGRLIDGGASLFLAPQWAVTDKAALRFAGTFYSQLTAPDSLGAAVAVQQARLAVQELTGDPSWLAYALYAHPNARVTAR